MIFLTEKKNKGGRKVYEKSYACSWNSAIRACTNPPDELPDLTSRKPEAWSSFLPRLI
jgi:hypothetical protein